MAGLLATIGFAGLLAPMEACGACLRLLYLGSTFIAMGMSLSGTVVAVRTIVLVNSQPACSCLYLLEQVQEQRLWRGLHPFALTHWSVSPLLFSTCLLMLGTYGRAEFALSALLSMGLVGYLDEENRLHFRARMRALEHRAKDERKEE